jgi:hypothetical protein
MRAVNTQKNHFVEMAATRFDQFASLPKELRDLIWDAAIRPRRPAAHIFSYFHSLHREAPKLTEQYAVRERFVDGSTTDEGWLGAPIIEDEEDDGDDEDEDAKYHKGEHFSWTDENPSAYLIDTGLWTACRESRDAMARRFRPGYWAPIRKAFCEQAKDWYFGCALPRHEPPDAPVTGGFIHEGEHRAVTVYPKSDLFIIRPVDGPWVADIGTLAQSGSFFSRLSGSRVTNVAFELPPGFSHWSDVQIRRDMKEEEKSIIQYIMEEYVYQLANFGHAWRIAPRIWFIDPDEERPAGTTLEDREVFHAVGCRYVELKPSEGGCAALESEIMSDVEEVRNRHFGWTSEDDTESDKVGSLRPYPDVYAGLIDKDFKVRFLVVEPDLQLP